MMKNSRFAVPCFSGECGHCVSCSSSHCVDISAPQADRSFPEILEMFDKPRIGEMGEASMNRMIRLREAWRDDFKDIYVLREIGTPSIYRKIETPHHQICSTPRCRAIYGSFPPYLQGRYQNYPVYLRDIRAEVKHDEPCRLCLPCLLDQGGDPRTRKFDGSD
jgi:hypothetical protein